MQATIRMGTVAPNAKLDTKKLKAKRAAKVALVMGQGRLGTKTTGKTYLRREAAMVASIQKQVEESEIAYEVIMGKVQRVGKDRVKDLINDFWAEEKEVRPLNHEHIITCSGRGAAGAGTKKGITQGYDIDVDFVSETKGIKPLGLPKSLVPPASVKQRRNFENSMNNADIQNGIAPRYMEGGAKFNQ